MRSKIAESKILRVKTRTASKKKQKKKKKNRALLVDFIQMTRALVSARAELGDQTPQMGKREKNSDETEENNKNTKNLTRER